MSLARVVLLSLSLLLLAGCGQKGKLYHSGEPQPPPSDTSTQPETDTTAPSESQPSSDF